MNYQNDPEFSSGQHSKGERDPTAGGGQQVKEPARVKISLFAGKKQDSAPSGITNADNSLNQQQSFANDASSNHRDHAKYSNFMMEPVDTNTQAEASRTSGGRDEIFDYVATDKRDGGGQEVGPRDEEDGNAQGPGRPLPQESAALVVMKGDDKGFRPFAGLDDLEPIEKRSQYSDDNEDADAIADERDITEDGRDDEDGVEGGHPGGTSQMQASRGGRAHGAGGGDARDEDELSEIVNSKQSSDEQMGPFLDEDQLKLDFFGKQGAGHDRGDEAYHKYGDKDTEPALKAVSDSRPDRTSTHPNNKHAKKKAGTASKGQQPQAARDDPEKLMVNNFMMDNESSLQRYDNQNTESCKEDQKQDNAQSPSQNNARDIYFLMQRYKDDNKGQGTTDICLLFSYWQANYCYQHPGSTDGGASASANASGAGPGILGTGPSQSNSNNLNTIKSSIALMNDEKTSSFINYNSKSFNNKTYYNNDARTTPNQNNTEEEDGGNFMRSREEQQCGRIGVGTSLEPSPISQARGMPGGVGDGGNPASGHHYARANYQMEIIDNEFEAPNMGSNDDQQYQLTQNQQLQLSELKGSIASPNTNLHTIGSMDADFNPKNINLKNQRIQHQQNKEKKPRVQVPKIQLNNNFGKQPHGNGNDKRGSANNIQMQISQISQLSQISSSAGNQFGNAGPTPGSNTNANGFIFQRESSNSLQKNLRQHSDSRQGQVDSILFSQKIKLDREKNINEIQLGNVKNQVLNGASAGHHHQGSLLQNSSIGGANQNSLLPQNMMYNHNNAANFSGGSIGLIAGREIDRNQLSVEIMNITPIMEEKEYYHNANNNYGAGGQGELHDFKMDDEPNEESADVANPDGKRTKNKGKPKKLHDMDSQVKINDHDDEDDEDRQQMNDDQNQFSFDKELNYFNPDAHGGQQTKQNHFKDEKSMTDQAGSPGAARQSQLQQQQAEDLSEIMDLEEKILVNDLEQIDQRFSIDKIARSPQKSTKSSKRKHRSDRAKNIFKDMDDNYSSINFISNSESLTIMNLFVGNRIFEGGATKADGKLFQRERRRFENNSLLLRRDYRVYDRFLEHQKLLGQVFGSLKMMRLLQNLPFIYQFKHFDVKSSVFMNKLPQELANLNELSPILDKKHAKASVVQDSAPFTHLQLIISHSFIGLCRQYLILHCLLKGQKVGIDFAAQSMWLSRLVEAYLERRDDLQSQPNAFQRCVFNWLKDSLNDQFCKAGLLSAAVEEDLGNFQYALDRPQERSSNHFDDNANFCQQYFTLHNLDFAKKRKQTTSSGRSSGLGTAPPPINFLGQKILRFEEEKHDDLGLGKAGQDGDLVIAHMGRSVERTKAGNLESGHARGNSGGSSARMSAGRAGPGGNRHSSGRRGLGEQHATRSAAVFDHLSSIDSEGHAAPYDGDGDEGDVLEVLQRTTQFLNGGPGNTSNGKEKQGALFDHHQGTVKGGPQSNHHTRLLKNDDTEYKERERKNLSKYRDRSEFSANSDLATFNLIAKAEVSNEKVAAGNILLTGESKNQGDAPPAESSQQKKDGGAGGQASNNTWVDYKRGRLRKNRKLRNNKKDEIEDKPKSTFDLQHVEDDNHALFFKTPDEKQLQNQGNQVPPISMKSNLLGLNTTPNDKNRDETKVSKTRRTNKSKSNNKHRARHGSSKSKSKSRFSNNLGFAQLQNAIENEEVDALENTQEIEKLLQEIDDGKNELDRFISREEENFSKKFNNKMSEAERVLQNSRRDGSTNNRCGGDSYRGALNFAGGAVHNRDQSQTQRMGQGITDHLQQNQHHNSISNNSGSFYFPLNKKNGGRDGAGAANRTNIKSNNISMLQNHPYNPRGANSGSIYGLSGKKERSSVGVHDGGFCGSSSNSSSSSPSSRNNNVSCCGKSQNLQSISDIENKNGGSQMKNMQYKNASTTHQIYSQNSQLLTDRPNFDKKLELGRLRNNLGNRHGGRQHNAASGVGAFADKSNERQMSIVSGNSKYSNGNAGPGGGGNHYNVHNSSYTNRQRFPFNNNLVNRSSAAVGSYQQHNYSNLQHNQQYSSLSRIGLQKISSGMSGGGYSNQSPSNGHQNFISQNKLASAIHEINEGQKNSTRRSGMNNMMLLEHTTNTRQNTSGFLANVNNNFQSTQNSYRTTTNHPPSSASANQNPILLKLKTTQMSRGGGSGTAGGGHGMAGTSSNVYQGGSGAGAATPGQMQTLNAAIGNSMMLQTTSDYPLSQRGAPHHHSSIHSIITPKSFGGARGSGLLGPGETSQGGRNASNLLHGVSPKKQMLNTQQKHTMQPILGQINLERSQTIGKSQRQDEDDNEDVTDMENMMTGGDHIDKYINQHDEILETEHMAQGHDQINIIDNELLDQEADNYDKQILIKQNTDQQFDEFKVASKAQRQSPRKADRSADGVEGNFDQQYLRNTSSLTRNDSKEKVKKSVLSIKMLRATTNSFYGGQGGTSSITGVNGAQSSRLPGINGLNSQNTTDHQAGANRKTHIHQANSQIKLRVKSLKKGDNTLISTSNLNSSVSKASAEKIRTSSNSSMGTSGARKLRLKFKPRNFNSKQGEGDQQKRGGDDQQDKASSHLEEGASAMAQAAQTQHLQSQDNGKVQSARSGIKAFEKRRDRVARGQRSQVALDGANGAKQTSGTVSSSNMTSHQASKASLAAQQPTGNNRHHQDNTKSKDNLNTQSAQQQQRGGPRSRLKQPSYANLKGHTSIRGGQNPDSSKNNEGYASKFRGRERDVKKDSSPQLKKQNARDKAEQDYQNSQNKVLSNSLEKQQQQQHKTLVQHHYYAAASMAQQNNAPGQGSARGNQRHPGGQASRRNAPDAQTGLHMGDSVSPQVPSRLHLSQQEQDNSLQQAQGQNHNLTSVSYTNNQQKNQTIMQGNQEDMAQKFQTASGASGARIGQSHKQAREAQAARPSASDFSKPDHDRLIDLLIAEFKRKKGKDVRLDVAQPHRLQTLVSFWQESLSKQRILTKLRVKQQQSFSAANMNNAETMRTTTSMPSKLSDKEKWLLNYLQGTDRQQLLTLGKESTTRNYGELAMIEEATLVREVCRFLKLDPQTQTRNPASQQSSRDQLNTSNTKSGRPDMIGQQMAPYQTSTAMDTNAHQLEQQWQLDHPGHYHQHHQSEQQQRMMYSMHSMQGSRQQPDQSGPTTAQQQQSSRNQGRSMLTQASGAQHMDPSLSAAGSGPAGMPPFGLGTTSTQSMPQQAQFSHRSAAGHHPSSIATLNNVHSASSGRALPSQGKPHHGQPSGGSHRQGSQKQGSSHGGHPPSGHHMARPSAL